MVADELFLLPLQVVFWIIAYLMNSEVVPEFLFTLVHQCYPSEPTGGTETEAGLRDEGTEPSLSHQALLVGAQALLRSRAESMKDVEVAGHLC